MNKVYCYTESCVPKERKKDTFYFELFSVPEDKSISDGHVGNGLLKELRRSKICPTVEAFDFAILAMSVVAADRAVLRKNSPDGWTRQIELTTFLHEPQKWREVKGKLEWVLRFLSGDFWSLNLELLPESLLMKDKYPMHEQDCVCLLSGGMDSLVGAIDLHESGRNPLFVSQIVRGDAEHQKEYAAVLGDNNLCQWSCYVDREGSLENSTRARSIIFFAFALLASCGISNLPNKQKEIFVPENGFISLNIPLDPLRMGSLSTKTTHPIYMKTLQEIWNDVGINVKLELPYRYKTKGEVLQECKNQDLMKRLIMGTTSCGKYNRHGYRHCGVCIPCLVRKASFLKAQIKDQTERGYCTANIKFSPSPDTVAAAMAVTQYEKYGIESLISGELSFVDGQEREKYVSVFERGLCEIRDLLKEDGVL